MLTRPQLRSQRTAEDFCDFLFGLGYLEPQYALKMEGKELFELLLENVDFFCCYSIFSSRRTMGR